MFLGPIRVFLVDDSPVALVILKRMLATSPDIEVVGTARNGREALAQLEQTRPKVICTDFYMPIMDGLEFTREVMATYPRPILVISSAVDSTNPQRLFPLLEAGALDVFPKPAGPDPENKMAAQLVQKIKILSGVYVFTRRRQEAGLPARPVRPASEGPFPAPAIVPVTALPENAPRERVSRVTGRPGVLRPFAARAALRPRPAEPIRVVVIGASTGGPQTLLAILGALPANFAQPVICVQHISPGFLAGLVEWLNSHIRLRVKVAEMNETPEPGTVYFPAEDTHLELDRRGRIVLSPSAPVDGHRPSVTVTFEAVARYYGPSATGVLLTGMGADGASGLRTLAEAGAVTIAQDEQSCVVFGMPKVAIEMGAARHVAAAADIAKMLLEYASGQRC